MKHDTIRTLLATAACGASELIDQLLRITGHIPGMVITAFWMLVGAMILNFRRRFEGNNAPQIRVATEPVYQLHGVDPDHGMQRGTDAPERAGNPADNVH